MKRIEQVRIFFSILVVFSFLIIHPEILSAQTKEKILSSEFLDSEKKSAWEKSITTVENSTTSSNYDIVSVQCEWKLDPTVRYISGRVSFHFLPLLSGMNELRLDLTHLLGVDSIEYHGNNLSFQHLSNDFLLIHFSSMLPVNVMDSVSVFYQGEPGVSGFGSFETTQHSGAPILWTLSEPYGSKEWWPCHQDLNDKIDTLDIVVVTPSQYKVASNGLLLSETISGNEKTTHWHSTYPIAAYLVGVAVSNYSVYSDTVTLSNGQSMPIVGYIYPEDSAHVRTKLNNDRFLDVFLFFDSLFGTYPFSREKYGQTQFGWSGGMEHQTMSFIGNFDSYLVYHELAHQWFGDKVTCGSWEDIWLNEGFATYLQGFGKQHVSPIIWPSFLNGILNTITSKPDGSVFCSDTTEVSRIFDYRLSYCKGAYLVHMLRWVIGDSAFFAGIRNYLSDPSLVYSYATTDQLKTHLEQSSGTNLDYFFDQWYSGQGYPSYHLEWNQKDRQVEFTLDQTQSHSSVSFYKMPVPIQFAGDATDTVIVFQNDFSGQHYQVSLDYEVRNIFIDPEHWIISAENTVQSLLEKNSSFVSINVFPNPAGEDLSLLVSEPALSIHHVSILDRCGRKVKEVSPAIPLRQFRFSIADLANGMYVLEVETGQGISYVKFVKADS